MKRLYRSQTNKMVWGVCGGVAEYFGIDPTIIRLIWAVICLGYGAGLLLYIIAAFILPEGPEAEA